MNKFLKLIAFIFVFNVQLNRLAGLQLSQDKRDYLDRILNRLNNQTSVEKFQSLSLVSAGELEKFLEDNKQGESLEVKFRKIA